MTDREFDELLKTAFDRYAKETLAKIPKKMPDIPGLSKSASKRRGTKRRNAALVLLSAACVSLLTLSVLLIAKLAGQDSAHPLPTLPAAPQGRPDNPVSTLSPTAAPGTTAAPSTEAPAISDATTDPSQSDSVTEQIYPEHFHSLLSGQPCSGDTGEFADLLLVQSELPELSEHVRTTESRAFDKRTGGSYEFWNGEVQVFLQYETPVLPVAVTFTFGDPALLPRDCILMGQSPDGSWVELQSYTCKLTDENVTVAFYLEDSGDSTRYTDFYLSYQYVAMPDENYQVPNARLYGFEGETSAFRFARYCVSGGSLYALSTNAEELTLPDNFGGSPLLAVRRGAISGRLAPELCALTIPEGVQTVEVSTFTGCVALQRVSLPATFALPIPESTSDSENGDPIPPEILRYEDANGDEIISAPLTALFKDCENMMEIRVAEDHAVLEFRDGSVYLRDSDILLFPGK